MQQPKEKVKPIELSLVFYTNDTLMGILHTFVTKKKFELAWDTQIPRNPKPNKTQKSQMFSRKNPKTCIFDPTIPKVQKIPRTRQDKTKSDKDL
jgi:hypothetical protein